LDELRIPRYGSFFAYQYILILLEDGLTSGLLAAISLGAECPFAVHLNGGYPTKRLPPPVPKWAEALGVTRYVKPEPTYVPWKKPKCTKRKPAKTIFKIGIVVAIAVVGYKFFN
jgi:hypothetical protein